MRLVNFEVSKKMDELRMDLNSQIIDVINSVIGEKGIPDIRKIMTSQNPVFWDGVDHMSCRLIRTTEEENAGNAWKTNSKPILASGSRQDYFRANYVVSQSSDEDRAMMNNSHDIFYL